MAIKEKRKNWNCRLGFHNDKTEKTSEVNKDGIPYYIPICQQCGKKGYPYLRTKDLNSRTFAKTIKIPYWNSCPCHGQTRERNMDATCPQCQSINIKLIEPPKLKSGGWFGADKPIPAKLKCLDCETHFEVGFKITGGCSCHGWSYTEFKKDYSPILF